MATGRQIWQRKKARRGFWSVLNDLPIIVLLLLALGLGGSGSVALQHLGLADWLLGAPAATEIATRSFAPCAGRVRTTCIVDGDTFWLDGTKFRIADINTPEIGAPACPAEAALGQKATRRLAELLSAGPFELAPADRDEDRYGRKLRIIERDGQSIGRQLIAEGLAHEWHGRRESWC